MEPLWVKVKEKSDFLQLIKDLNIFIFSRYFCRQQTPRCSIAHTAGSDLDRGILEWANAVKFAQERQEDGFDFTSRGHCPCLSLELLRKDARVWSFFQKLCLQPPWWGNPSRQLGGLPQLCTLRKVRARREFSLLGWGLLLYGELPPSSLLGFGCGLDGWHPRSTPVQCHAEASVNSGSSSCYQCWEEI